MTSCPVQPGALVCPSHLRPPNPMPRARTAQLCRACHRRRQGPLRLERPPPWPHGTDFFPAARRGSGRIPARTRRCGSRSGAARPARARGCRHRYPGDVARDPRRSPRGAGADRSVRRRRARRRGRGPAAKDKAFKALGSLLRYRPGSSASTGGDGGARSAAPAPARRAERHDRANPSPQSPDCRPGRRRQPPRRRCEANPSVSTVASAGRSGLWPDGPPDLDRSPRSPPRFPGVTSPRSLLAHRREDAGSKVG